MPMAHAATKSPPREGPVREVFTGRCWWPRQSRGRPGHIRDPARARMRGHRPVPTSSARIWCRMKYLVILTRTYEVDASCQSDAIMKAFDAEHIGPEHPTVMVERLPNTHRTEAEVVQRG